MKATLRPEGEKADKFVGRIEPRTTRALSAKSRGLTRRFLFVGEAFPSRSNASGSKRFDSAKGDLLKVIRYRGFCQMISRIETT